MLYIQLTKSPPKSTPTKIRMEDSGKRVAVHLQCLKMKFINIEMMSKSEARINGWTSSHLR